MTGPIWVGSDERPCDYLDTDCDAPRRGKPELMKVEIELPVETVNAALSEPRSRYWAVLAKWDPVSQTGKVRELDGTEHDLDADALKSALSTMATVAPRRFAELLSGEWDGYTGDILLQLMAFGQVLYG